MEGSNAGPSDCPCCLLDIRSKSDGHAIFSCSHFVCERCLVSHVMKNGIFDERRRSVTTNCPLCRKPFQLCFEELLDDREEIRFKSLLPGLSGKYRRFSPIYGDDNAPTLFGISFAVPRLNQLLKSFGIKNVPLGMSIPLSDRHSNLCAECDSTYACFPYKCQSTDYDFDDPSNSFVRYFCPRCIRPRSDVSYANDLPTLVKFLENRFGNRPDCQWTDSELLEMFVHKGHSERVEVINSMAFFREPEPFQVLTMLNYFRIKNIIALCSGDLDRGETQQYFATVAAPYMVKYCIKDPFGFSYDQSSPYDVAGIPNVIHKCLDPDNSRIPFCKSALMIYMTRQRLHRWISFPGYNPNVCGIDAFIKSDKLEFIFADKSPNAPAQIVIDVDVDLHNEAELRRAEEDLKRASERVEKLREQSAQKKQKKN